MLRGVSAGFSLFSHPVACFFQVNLGCCTAVRQILWQERFLIHGTAATAASEPDTARDSLRCMSWLCMASSPGPDPENWDASTAPSSLSGSHTFSNTRLTAWSKFNRTYLKARLDSNLTIAAYEFSVVIFWDWQSYCISWCDFSVLWME